MAPKASLRLSLFLMSLDVEVKKPRNNRNSKSFQKYLGLDQGGKVHLFQPNKYRVGYYVIDIAYADNA